MDDDDKRLALAQVVERLGIPKDQQLPWMELDHVESLPKLLLIQVLLSAIATKERVTSDLESLRSEDFASPSVSRAVAKLADSDVDLDALATYVRFRQLGCLELITMLHDGAIEIGVPVSFKVASRYDDEGAEYAPIDPNLSEALEFLAPHSPSHW